MKKILQLLLLALIFVLTRIPVPVGLAHSGAGQYKAYQVRAIFLFNLANFVSWPKGSFGGPGKPIRITVVGQEKFADFLEEVVKGESARGRPIRIDRTPTPENLENCHILFMDAVLEEQWPKLLQSVSGKRVLTVSNGESFTRKGGMVGLVAKNKRIVIEIHAERAKSSGLQISSKLLKLARVTR